MTARFSSLDMSTIGFSGSSQTTFSLSLDGNTCHRRSGHHSARRGHRIGCPNTALLVTIFREVNGVSAQVSNSTATQVGYDGFDAGGIYLPICAGAYATCLRPIQPPVDISVVSFGGQATDDSGSGRVAVRFRTTDGFSEFDDSAGER